MSCNFFVPIITVTLHVYVVLTISAMVQFEEIDGIKYYKCTMFSLNISKAPKLKKVVRMYHISSKNSAG